MTRALVLWADNRSANYGVRVLASGAEELAKRAWGADTIVEFQDYGVGDSPISFGRKAILADMSHLRRDITDRISSFDVVLDTGAGDSFTDIYGYNRFLTMINAARIAKRVGVPRVVMPQTVGPFDRRAGRALGKWALHSAELVVARDSASARYCDDLGRTADLLATDMVFALPVQTPDKQRDVIINVSGLLWAGNSHTDHIRYQTAVIDLVATLVSSGRDVALLAHVIGSKQALDDVQAIKEVQTRVGVDLELLVPRDLTEARKYLASANVVIGSRMHACLNALSQGVPAISWAYSRKFAPLMGDLGWKFVVDLSTSMDPVGDTIHQLNLLPGHSVDDLRLRADEHIGAFVQALGSVDLGRQSLRSGGTPSQLPAPVVRVLENGNCTGCGACTMIYPDVDMALDDLGFLRPRATANSHSAGPSAADDRFRSVCPGLRVVAAQSGTKDHPVFGRYAGAWEAHATETAVRHAGSSGGVLTALSTWLLETGRSKSVAGVRGEKRRTVPLLLTTRAEALAAAGSRYAPASALSQFATLPTPDVLVGKPCEASALRQFVENDSLDDQPLILSFFCAGTPSQRATDKVIAKLGEDPEKVDAVRYRGEGWPGNFVATSNGAAVQMSYHESWGKHLGRDLQSICKICPDGTGGAADVSVGDYWQTDPQGFPLFQDAPGSSVVIARTDRGVALVEDAIAAGILQAQSVDLDAVARVQPLQRERRLTLSARLFGRRLALQAVPKYYGFGSLRRLVIHRWRSAPRVAAGSFVRARSSGPIDKRSRNTAGVEENS